jgi:hypothetical protein
VTANRAASGAALGTASDAAFHMAPGLAIQNRVRPASGLSSESNRPRLLRRLEPEVDVLPTPADRRLSWLNGLNRELGQSMTKASELERNPPCPGMGLELDDHRYQTPAVPPYPYGFPEFHRKVCVIAWSGCVGHLTSLARSNPDRLSCTITRDHYEQPNSA